jgi:hypothetical protein
MWRIAVRGADISAGMLDFVKAVRARVGVVKFMGWKKADGIGLLMSTAAPLYGEPRSSCKPLQQQHQAVSGKLHPSMISRRSIDSSLASADRQWKHHSPSRRDSFRLLVIADTQRARLRIALTRINCVRPGMPPTCTTCPISSLVRSISGSEQNVASEVVRPRRTDLCRQSIMSSYPCPQIVLRLWTSERFSSCDSGRCRACMPDTEHAVQHGPGIYSQVSVDNISHAASVRTIHPKNGEIRFSP